MYNLLKRLGIVLMLCIAYGAHANTRSSFEIMQGLKSCNVARPQHPELDALYAKITAAPSLESARQLALAPTEEALNALHNARSLMPMSADLQSAEERIKAMRAQIEMATQQQQIADQFSGVLVAGLDNDHAAHLGIGKVGCDYSSGEVIAIVIGLILGIIPGLILMALLC